MLCLASLSCLKPEDQATPVHQLWVLLPSQGSPTQQKLAQLSRGGHPALDPHPACHSVLVGSALWPPCG